MDIGKLNKRITFLQLKKIEDEYGSHTNWEPAFTVWATVKADRTSEPTLKGSVQRPQASFTIYVRYRKSIRPDMRIAYAGRLLELTGPPIDVEERHAMMQLYAEEVFEDGEYGS